MLPGILVDAPFLVLAPRFRMTRAAAAALAADTYFAVLRVVEAGSDLGLCTAGTAVTSTYVQRKVRPTSFE